MNAKASLGVLCSLLLFVTLAHGWDGSPSPFDGKHLVVVRPPEWREAGGPRFQRPLTVAGTGATFGGRIVPLSRAVVANIEVPAAGRYDLWVRIAQAKRTPLEAQLLQNGKAVFTGQLNHDEGEEGRGGPDGYRAYRQVAEVNVPGGREVQIDLLGGNNVGGLKDNILDEMSGEKVTEHKRWANSFRLEKVDPNLPFYWWKISGAQLEAGDYELRLKPAGAATDAKTAAQLDAALLTTNTSLTYPFNGDIDAPPATYMRFRIDALPPKASSMGVSLNFLLHHHPFGTGSGVGPDGLPKEGDVPPPFTKTGFTPWYRLNDIKFMSGFGAGVTMNLGIDGNARGQTQFATFPHDDAVNHTFDWNELDGKTLALSNNATGQVYPVRDYARIHYQYALAATDSKVYPLLRGQELSFGNGWGNASGGAQEYMVKTMRLLGMNAVSSHDPVKNRERYGWWNVGGAYWPPVYMPYEPDAEKKYDDYYKNVFKDRQLYENATIYQIADEPGEINSNEYSAPYWRHEVVAKADDKDGKGYDRYVDVTGSSELSTVRMDYSDCVFEGVVGGANIGLRAGTDDPQMPKKFVYWHFGYLNQYNEFNLVYGKAGDGMGTRQLRQAANMRPRTPFKIVYQRGRAALFVNDTLMFEHEGVPEKGGFSIYGPAKSIYSLHIRPIRADEHLDVTQGFMGQKLDASSPLGGDDDIKLNVRDFEPKAGEEGAFKPKPLKVFVEQDMVPAGGVPLAQVGFREWCAAKGMTPALFGKKTWGEVRMLTVSSLIETPADRRRFYWSRRYSNYLTPRMFSLATQAVHRYAPNKQMRGFVALSGHSLYMHQQWLPMDLFQLAAEGGAMMPGMSDWMSNGGWRWDSRQAVGYSVAQMNSGARRYGKDWGQEPASYPMMHCVGPSVFRAYTMLSNQVKHISYWTYGPSYAATEGFWSDSPGSYQQASFINNRAAMVDDVLPKARMRPSRVAMLYSMSNEYWDPNSSYGDKRAAFLTMSHEYYQPELVTEEQIADGALQHYDALYLLDTAVSGPAQDKIAQWVQNGGLLWACSTAASMNEYGEPLDLLAKLAGLTRTYGKERAYKVVAAQAETFPRGGPDDYMVPAAGETKLEAQSIFGRGNLTALKWDGSRVRASYQDGVAALSEKTIGKGKVVYLGHRAGATSTRLALKYGGVDTLWAEAPRAVLTLPLHEAKVEREVVLSESLIMTQPLSTPEGTVLLLYNMRSGECRDLKIGLKEPAKPLSVQAFGSRSMEIKDIPFEYSEGRVWVTLPVLEAGGVGNIIRVRRTPPPADERVPQLKAHTVQQLKSSEPRTISAGLWFAGLNPQWQLGDSVDALLSHEAWEVRLAAAEAMWRLERKASAPLLLTALQKEKDPHVLSEMLFALAKLGHPQAQALCLQFLAHERDYVRRQAMRAAVVVVDAGGTSAATKAFALQVAKAGRKNKLPNDDWGTGTGWKNKLIALGDPKGIVDEALAVFQDPPANDPDSPWGNDRDLLIGALAGNDAFYAEYVKRGLPGGQTMQLSLARRRKAPELANAVAAAIDKLEDANVQNFIWAVIAQQDKPLAHQVFAARTKLPAGVAGSMTLMMSFTLRANKGVVLEDWAKHIEQTK